MSNNTHIIKTAAFIIFMCEEFVFVVLPIVFGYIPLRICPVNKIFKIRKNYAYIHYYVGT